MSVTDDFKAIVQRLRGWGFSIREEPGCYSRSNGGSWSAGKPIGHGNHHYVCGMSPEQSYIDGLVHNLTAGNTVQWFADVNGRGYLIGAGPMNHFGTGNSYVLNRTKQDQPNYGLASGPGDISGNPHFSATECQHPGDSTPWPQTLLDIMFAINAAEFLQWGYKAERAINHASWTNRKIDMSWLGGPPAGETAGRELVANVQKYMDGHGTTPPPPLDEGFLMSLSEQQQKELYDTVQWLKTKLTDNLFTPGTAQGQKSVGSTIAATLQTSQQVLNEVK